MPITISIDLKKIDQSKCKSHTNGAKYCEIVLMDRQDQYGNDYMVVQGVSKEERDAGVRGAILGNGKIRGGQQQAAPAPQQRCGYSTPSGQPRTPQPNRRPPVDPDLDVDQSDIPF